MNSKQKSFFFTVFLSLSFSMWKIVEVSVWDAGSEVMKAWLTTPLGPVVPSGPASAHLSLIRLRTPHLTPALSTR